jgi:predicted TPR repeat methyltransferase
MSSSKDYWEERLRSNFGLHGTGFIGRGEYYNKWMYKVRKTVFLKKIKSVVDMDFSKACVLDIGSGTGFYIDLWKHLGVNDITGLDITSVAIENLRRKYPRDEFYELDITGNIDILSGKKFNIISAFDVLFHITDDKRYNKAISNIHLLLDQGGYFVFSENFVRQGRAIRSSQQVTRTLTFIHEALEQKTFDILHHSPMFVIMNAPVDTRSRVLRKAWNITSSLIKIDSNVGLVLGAFLYPIELMLVFSIKESPTTEIMICKK